jgi:UDP-N-acetylglucosamine--N-acetylmuramyl-(pentapeptide) pyrophosphoryl-undecaprenol N-acetylglucosamine transferase
MINSPTRLLIAASGTGGHLFPAIAVAEQLPEYHIQWLGVPDRLEKTLVPDRYPLHTVAVSGFQERFSLKTIKTFFGLILAIFKVKNLIQKQKIELIFTTGGYIAAPTILAARLTGIPVILHESNFIPGKVTKWFSAFYHTIALGFAETKKYLPQAKTIWVSTPVRTQFRSPQTLNLPIPDHVPLMVILGGSQGAVAVNQLVRQCVQSWLDTGTYIVHLTGEKDPEANSFIHPHYLTMPFYDNIAGLLQRADLAISRAGAGALTELAVTQTPAILIPYPYAAENHQFYNAKVFEEAGAAIVFLQSNLDVSQLENQVLDLLNFPEKRALMREKMKDLSIADSAERVADLIKKVTIKR